MQLPIRDAKLWFSDEKLLIHNWPRCDIGSLN
jgi:hypothetical protein